MVFRENEIAIIGTAVIDTENFIIRDGLVNETVETATEVLFNVIDWDDNCRFHLNSLSQR